MAIDFFKEKINVLYREQKLSASALAREIHISPAAMNFYLSGERRPDIETLSKICTYFNCSADWLLGLSNVRSSSSDVQAAVKSLGIDERFIHDINQLDESSRKALFKLLTLPGLIETIIPDLIELQRVRGALAEKKYFTDNNRECVETTDKRLDFEQGTVMLSQKEAVNYYAYKIGSRVSTLLQNATQKFLSFLGDGSDE